MGSRADTARYVGGAVIVGLALIFGATLFARAISGDVPPPDAHCVEVDELGVWVCGTTTTQPSTTTTSSSTTTTQATTTTTAPTTTTTTAPSTTTSTVPPTTTTSSPTTTTTAPPSSIDLTSDLIVSNGGNNFLADTVINANGHQIMVMSGATLTWSNVDVHDASRIMFMNGAGASTLHDVVCYDCGIEGELGFYPFHWHLNGDTVAGTVVTDSGCYNSANRCFVPHGSDGISLLDTFAYDTEGTPYWWDAPGANETCSFLKFCTVDNSNDILIDGAFVSGVTGGGSGGIDGFRLSGFKLGAGSGNVLVNSHCEGVQGQVDDSCYHWPEDANQNVGGNVWIFENNTSDNSAHGIFTWQNDSNDHIIDGFVGGGIDHGAYGNNYVYRNVVVPYIEVHATGWAVEDSTVGDIISRRHQFSGPVTFTNVTVTGQVLMQDAPSGSQQAPVTLTFINSDVSCSDVVWVNPHPNSRVVIDGEDC